MKNCARILMVSIVMLTLTFALTGCSAAKKSSGSSSASGSVSSTEPLTGSWSMSRVSIEPQPPSIVPGFVIDQIIPKSATWKISTSGGKLKLDYGGRSTWFNPLGINVSVKSVTPSEASDKKSCIFEGGGSANAEKLPGALSFIGNVRNISADYTDEVSVTLTSQDAVNAVISYSATGTYNSGEGNENFSYQGKITYSGKRK